MTSFETLKTVTLRLLAYCQANDFAGYDPYDAVNSKFFSIFPFMDCRIPRLVLTQLLKRSPINFRPLLLIPKAQNPKALALFLMSFLKLKKLGLLQTDDLIHQMIQNLITLSSPSHQVSSREPCTVNHEPSPYYCWGYSFPGKPARSWSRGQLLTSSAPPSWPMPISMFTNNTVMRLALIWRPVPPPTS